ncbi:unnamed protein product [Enterobius vermicularis]|uniref:DUF4377 domain-containing protein n=1 Tax=Enterobius vermicularis TaxID=51028 RepID=A0A0N4VMF5_ENTVE|nr:unnamed protein product [Enterobius vermicularis]
MHKTGPENWQQLEFHNLLFLNLADDVVFHSTFLLFHDNCKVSVCTSDARLISGCDKSLEPKTWLTTRARGIWDWATVGQLPTGPHFCLKGNQATYSLEVDYHVHVTPKPSENETQSVVLLTKTVPDKNAIGNRTDCGTGNPQIHYCMMLCWLKNDMKLFIIDTALSSKNASYVANKIYDQLGTPSDTAVTVYSVNLDAVPQAQLNQQVYYGDPNYCSVYIGMETVGIPYLYEIQVVKVIKD